jgi:eukaryotic-like serine/threonine-protein kinase
VTVDGRVVAGRYRLGRQIGSGAMGIVWQAHDELLYRTVAVKQLLLQPGQSEAEADEAKRRAMREGRIAARLQHPNAVAVFDVVDEGDGMPWLVMEYVPSRSLSAVLEEQGTLPPQEAARIGMHVASALAAAHAAGIVHRDVKPGNVLLGEDGVVKITDFGISRAAGDSTVTATGMLAGTPAYLAPEIAKGHDPTPSSDVFSLGATLYAAVEGIPPFGLSDNPLALLHKVASGQIDPPRQAGPLTAPLLSLLSSEPTERVNMARARDTLGAVASGRPATALPMPAAVPGPTAVAPRPVAPAATRVEQRPLGVPHVPPRPASPVRPKGQPEKAKLNRGAAIGIAVAVVGAVLVGIIAVSLNLNKNQPNANGSGTPGGQGGGSSAISHQNSPAPISRAPVNSDPSGDQEVQLVKDLYAQLPGNAQAAAAAYLSPTKYTSPSIPGGVSGFVDSMSSVSSVQLRNVAATGPYVVEADEHFVTKDGSKLVQHLLFSINWTGTQIYIDKVQIVVPPRPEN